MWRLSAANARVEEKKKEKEIKPIFARLLLTVNNRRGQNSNSALLPNGGLCNLESFFFFSLSPFLKKKKKNLFREELAMRLDLTEARVQVSVHLYLKKSSLHVACKIK